MVVEFEVQIAHSVEEVGQEAWDRLAGARPFASYRWYRFGEAVLADNLPVYIILSRGREPVARATFWLRRNEPVPMPAGWVRGVMERLLRRWPLLICQAPLADVPGLVLPDPPLRDEALAVIGQQALAQARQHGASFVAYVYLEEAEVRWPGWPVAYASAELPEPGTRLALTRPDFESYLGALSKKSRRQYRSNCQKSAELGIEVKRHLLRAPLDGRTLDAALALIRNVEVYYEVPPFPWARAAHEQAGLVDAVWLSAEIEGRLVGCSLLIGDRGAWRWLLLGRDYGVEYAYFQLAYETVRCAIEQGGRVLWGGTGSYETKRRLGFEVTGDNYAVFAGRGALLQRAGRWLAQREESRVQDSDES
jgi:predicted N-acyltransferase